MLNNYGVVPLQFVESDQVLARFPSFSNSTAGGPVPADCQVALVQLPPGAQAVPSLWCWKPVEAGYVVSTRNLPIIQLKNHLRGIRQLQDEQGCLRIWPWFNPRYMKAALSNLHGQDLLSLVGPVDAFSFAANGQVEVFHLDSGQIQRRWSS